MNNELKKNFDGGVLEFISDTSLLPRANYYGLRTTDRAYPHVHKLSWYTAGSKKHLTDYMYLYVSTAS